MDSDPRHALPATRALRSAGLNCLTPAADDAWLAAPAPGDGSALALTDALTGLYSRAALPQAIGRAYHEACRYRHPLACALVDLDHLAQVNTDFGPLVGDEALREVAALLRASFCPGDLLFRHAGGAFALLMPRADARHGRRACERLLDQLRARPVATPAGPIQVTASAGVAAYVNGNFLRPQELLTAAGCALCSAKASGRDRVVVAEARARPPQVMACVA